MVDDNTLTMAVPRYNTWLTDNAIEKMEGLRNAKYVGEFPVREHSTQVGALFWQASPPHDYSHYFFIYRNYTGIKDHPDNGKLFITSGAHMDRRILSGVRTKSGDFIYSRGRHDFIEHDGSMVDGGDSYMRCSADATVIKFEIIEDRLVELVDLCDAPVDKESIA